MYHSTKEAEKAEVEFNKMFRDKERPSEIIKAKVELKEWPILELLQSLSLVGSKQEAQRLIGQGGIRLNNQVVTNWRVVIGIKAGDVVQVGKRKFVEIEQFFIGLTNSC